MEKLINLAGLSEFLKKSKDLFAEKTILTGANKMIVLTQAQYDALPTKDANTLYFIK